MLLTGVIAAKLWFQSRQDYRPPDTKIETTLAANKGGSQNHIFGFFAV